MAGEPAVVDASVLIAHLHREEGRADRSRELLEDAEGGQIQLWAPVVIHGGGGAVVTRGGPLRT